MANLMKMADILNLTDSEVNNKIMDLKKERFNLTVNSNTNNGARVRAIRKTIARLKTAISQRRIND